MSGTSLDGLDIACCEYFHDESGGWRYNLLHTESRPYTESIHSLLKNATQLSSEELLVLDVELGKIFGSHIREVINKTGLRFDFVASHGHTVFHQPEKGFTYQIGNGYEIAKSTGIPAICDFRSKDVSLGGQGAPLVPIGDRYLFGQYDACVNLGGISNISFEEGQNRIAFDICPTNMILNHLASQAGHIYDHDGILAKSGDVDDLLLSSLKEADKLKSSPRVSLGYEWVAENILSRMDSSEASIENKLATAVAYITDALASVVNELPPTKVLITGGGAHNVFLMKHLAGKLKSGSELIKPDNRTINFKEAIIFGFLGILKARNEVNCLSSVTGASKDSVGGIIYE